MTDTGEDDRERARPAEAHAADVDDIYAPDGSVRSDFLMQVGAAVADRDILFLRRHVAHLHESEMGDLLEAIQPDQRRALVSLLGADFDLAELTEVDVAIRLDSVVHLAYGRIAAAIGVMDSDVAVCIREDLDEEDRVESVA